MEVTNHRRGLAWSWGVRDTTPGQNVSPTVGVRPVYVLVRLHEAGGKGGGGGSMYAPCLSASSVRCSTHERIFVAIISCHNSNACINCTARLPWMLFHL